MEDQALPDDTRHIVDGRGGVPEMINIASGRWVRSIAREKGPKLSSKIRTGDSSLIGRSGGSGRRDVHRAQPRLPVPLLRNWLPPFLLRRATARSGTLFLARRARY